MSKIIISNLQNNIKEKSYLMQITLTIIIYSIVFLQVLPSMQTNSNIKNMTFVMQYLFFILDLSLFTTMLSIVITNICIREKVCNRIELYLANGVPIKKIFYAYSISTFILSVIGIFLFNCITSTFFIITNNLVAINSLLNFKMILFVSSILLFCFSISLILNAIVLLIKDMSVIRNITFLSSFFLIFGGSYLLKPLIMLKLNIDFITLVTLIIFVFSAIILSISFSLGHKLNNENIILSLKQ